ncbi:pyridoxamine 5'-phosphate oxidase family protein [Alicyclobacillaceae bacterium I2511]|nr:pyridoxamine 5'-phosphate oxidase family protein [Alicyclobacillaceae bacterium I2511]
MNPPDRGSVQRPDRIMLDADAREFLKHGQVAHVATICNDGGPYVIPLVYVYEGGNHLYLHTGAIRMSQFLDNVKREPRICLEISEMGPLQPGKRYACNSALVYTSVVAYGDTTIVEDEKTKIWFFDRLLEKYGNPEWSFEPGYPALQKIVLYEVELGILTGKRSEGLRH